LFQFAYAKPATFFLYSASTNDDTHQMVSLDSQAAELRQLAKREGIRIVETFEESQSAKQPGAPSSTKMLDRLFERRCQGTFDMG